MIKPGGPLEATTGPVLVVDDEPAVRGLFARALRDAGYDTLEAADARSASVRRRERCLSSSSRSSTYWTSVGKLRDSVV